jgi:hypothetical protein
LRYTGGLLGIFLLLGATPAAGLAQPPAAFPPRPAYQVLRHNEDWSFLSKDDPARPGDFFDPLKYIEPLEHGPVWLSLGAQMRWRLEAWDDFNFGAPPAADDEDVFVLSRLFTHVDLHLGEHVRGFLEGKSAFCIDRDLIGGCRTLDRDEFDLQNGFVDVTIPLPGDGELTLRTGRQELLLGKQRLVSPLDWSNTRRTFDGFTAILKVKRWTVTGLLTRLVGIRKYDFNESRSTNVFYGVYAAGKVPSTDVGLDLYWLGWERKRAAFSGTAGREDRHTLGARISGEIAESSLDYDLEGAYQFGEVGNGAINAFMIASQIGYSPKDLAGKPRFYVGYDFASGDRGMGGGVQTFNQLFPLGHAYLGFIDTVARQNINAPSAGVSFKPLDKLLVKADGHYFWRASDSDALYNAGGGVVRPGFGGSAYNIGGEIDLTVKYQFDRHAAAIAGYSHFFADDFIEQSGPSRDIDFLYLTLQYTF